MTTRGADARDPADTQKWKATGTARVLAWLEISGSQRASRMSLEPKDEKTIETGRL